MNIREMVDRLDELAFDSPLPYTQLDNNSFEFSLTVPGKYTLQVK